MTRGTAGPVGFDLDLTLIDSQSAILAAWTEVALETGTRIDLDSVTRRMGIKLEDEVACWFPSAERDAAAAAYRRHYVRLAPQLTTPLPGAAEALAAVRQASGPSSSPRNTRSRSGPAWSRRDWRPTTSTRTCTGRKRPPC